MPPDPPRNQRVPLAHSRHLAGGPQPNPFLKSQTRPCLAACNDYFLFFTCPHSTPPMHTSVATHTHTHYIGSMHLQVPDTQILEANISGYNMTL